jgi:4-amino-4-deoxy-L-arabinose transferase-like glycosyltransferase
MVRKWLWAIIFLALLLRVPFLDAVPVGLTPDEASFGYDAYSIIKTGKDQWGHVLPLVLESFGDFKAPLYTYLTIPSVALFGLTKEAIRLPNAFLGVGAVLVVYLLIAEFGKIQNIKKGHFFDFQKWGLLGAFFVAINPWHIQLSRGAFEANMTAFFLPLGIFFFLKAIKNPHYYIYSAIIFGLNLFTYHAAKVVTPVIVIALLFIFRKELFTSWKKQVNAQMYFYSAITIFVLFLVLTAGTFLGGAGRRASDVSIFNGALEAQADERLLAISNGMNPTIARALHNKYFVIADRFTDNYISYFSPDFLFENGARETTYGMVPGLGTFYAYELIFFMAFLVYSAKNFKEKYIHILIVWIFASPIPASLTMGVGLAANRAATMLPVLSIASACGAVFIWRFVTSKLTNIPGKVFSFGLLLVMLTFLLSFVNQYVEDSYAKSAKGMLYGNLEAASWLKENASDFNRIIVSRRLSEPHIYFALAHTWDPIDYQKNTEDWNRYKDEGLKFLDQLSSYKLGKYYFKQIEDEDYMGNTTTLLVGRPEEIPDSLEIVKRFYYPNGEPAIYIAKPYQQIYAFSIK